MAVVCVGDVHGKIWEFQKLIERRTKPEDLVVQCGDLGMGFCFIPHFPSNVRWIRGNHDDPQMSRMHSNYLGDYGYLPEYKLFYLAGAWSIDHQWRKASMLKGGETCWWLDEELSTGELYKAVELYEKVKPEIVISHEAPASVVPYVLARNVLKFDTNSPMYNPLYNDFNRPEKLECIKTRTSQALQSMIEIHRPRFHAFGHYHQSRGIDMGSTFFKCCAELEAWTVPGT